MGLQCFLITLVYFSDQLSFPFSAVLHTSQLSFNLPSNHHLFSVHRLTSCFLKTIKVNQINVFFFLTPLCSPILAALPSRIPMLCCKDKPPCLCTRWPPLSTSFTCFMAPSVFCSFFSFPSLLSPSHQHLNIPKPLPNWKPLHTRLESFWFPQLSFSIRVS